MKRFFQKFKLRRNAKTGVLTLAKRIPCRTISTELAGPSQSMTADPDENRTQVDDNTPALPVQTFIPTPGNYDNTEYDTDDEDSDMDPASRHVGNAGVDLTHT